MKWKIKAIIPILMTGFVIFGIAGMKGYAAESSYNITLVYNDGVTEDQVIQTKNASDLPTPTREGYEFDGWYIAEEKVGIGTKELNSFTNPNSSYPWTLGTDGVWSSGNKGYNSTTSSMISEEFTLLEDGVLSFTWRSYGESGHDYTAYDIYDVTNGVEKNEAVKAPVTGDNIGIYVILLVVSLFGIVFLNKINTS